MYTTFNFKPYEDGHHHRRALRVIIVGHSTNLKRSKATSRTPNRPSKATKSAKSPWWKFEERGTGVSIDYRDLRE